MSFIFMAESLSHGEREADRSSAGSRVSSRRAANHVLARRQHDVLPDSGASPAFTVNVCENASPGRERLTGDYGQAGEPAADRRHRLAVARSMKYGRIWQLLGNVRSTTDWLMFSTSQRKP